MAKKDAAPSRETIALTMQDVYDGPAWHGPSVIATLRGVTPALASRRIARGRNTIWEIVLHLAYTRHTLLVRMGAKTERFPRRLKKAWWPVTPDRPTAAAWREDLALLATYQQLLLDAIPGTSDAALRRVRRGKKRSVAHELLNVAVHDAYHAGQIQLLKLATRQGR